MQTFRVIVAGSRTFHNYDFVERTLCYLLSNFTDWPANVEIVSGAAKGADKLGEMFASKFMLHVRQFPANWSMHGKRAGYLRNVDMAKYANALVAFWDGQSKGTKHMIDTAVTHGLQVKIIHI